MRSRTEMVTTNFVDSEEDFSDDDNSEEDWRPSASGKKGKKQKCRGAGSAKRGRKRKSSLGPGTKNSKRNVASEESDEDELNDSNEDDYNYNDFESSSVKKKSKSVSTKKNVSDKNVSNATSDETLDLLVYIKDLKGMDPNKNNSLCLWRKDTNNLLQKYIRVKTSPEQFLFTSSSVYSSFDYKRTADFYNIKVKSIDSNCRRVKIINPSELHKISLKINKNKSNSDDDISGDEKSDLEENKQNCTKPDKSLEKTSKPVPNDKEHDEDDDEQEENDEEEDDCDLEEDDYDDVEEDED